MRELKINQKYFTEHDNISLGSKNIELCILNGNLRIDIKSEKTHSFIVLDEQNTERIMEFLE